MEQFKEYKGYFIGSEGTIIGKKGTPIGYAKKDGYVYVIINGKERSAHRLVAELWIKNDNPFATQVDHINGIRNDNRVDNLRWVSAADNRKNRHTDSKYKEFDASHYAKHKDAMLEQHKKYRLANQEKIKEQKKEYRKKNRDRLNEYKRKKRKDNK